MRDSSPFVLMLDRRLRSPKLRLFCIVTLERVKDDLFKLFLHRISIISTDTPTVKEAFFVVKNFAPWSRDLPHSIVYIHLNPNLQ